VPTDHLKMISDGKMFSKKIVYAYYFVEYFYKN